MAKAPVRKTVEQEDLPTPKQTTQPPLKAGGEQVIASKAKGIETIGNPQQWKILSQADGFTARAMEIPLGVGCVVAVETSNGVATQFVPNVVIHADINGGNQIGKRIRRNSMR